MGEDRTGLVNAWVAIIGRDHFCQYSIPFDNLDKLINGLGEISIVCGTKKPVNRYRQGMFICIIRPKII